MFTTYQEIEAKQIIPALRNGLASALRDLGIPQNKIASLLNMTEGAISQYLQKKRASEIVFSENVKMKIAESAERIFNGASHIEEMQKLIKYIEQKNLICVACKTHNEGVIAGCRICFT